MSTVKDQKIIRLQPGDPRRCTYSHACVKGATHLIFWTQKGTSRGGSFSRQTRQACEEHAEMYAKRANIPWPLEGGSR